MLEDIRWLNQALSNKDLVLAMMHYRIQEDFVVATDGRMTAGRPWPYGGTGLIPGHEFEKVLQRMPDNAVLEWGDGFVVVKGGRLRARIKTLPVEDWHEQKLDVAWKKVPPDLLGKMAALRPFISDDAHSLRQWALGISIKNGWLYATNNVVAVGTEMKGFLKRGTTIPLWAVDFLLSREGVTHWAQAEHFLAFKWADDSFMKTSLLEGGFPDGVGDMIKNIDTATLGHNITDSFRQAVDRVGGLSDSVTVKDGALFGVYKAATITENLEDEVPDSIWTSRHIGAVVQTAERWNPTTWPEPVAFEGHGVQGLIVGRSS